MSELTSSGAINDKAGSNKWTLWGVDDAYAPLASWTSYGIGSIKETTQDQTNATTNLENESGDVEQTEEKYEIMLTGIIMDTSKALIDFLSITVKNKFYGLHRKRLNIDGKTQEWFYPFGKVAAQHSVKSPGGAASMPFKFTALNNASAITISTVTLASIGAYVTAAVTIPAAGFFSITETA